MASGQEVYMDTDAVNGMASRFGTIGEVMEAVSKTLEVLHRTLMATAFIGMVGGLAVAKWIEVIKPRVDKLAADCKEMDKDLKLSVRAYQRGDQQGATRFY